MPPTTNDVAEAMCRARTCLNIKIHAANLQPILQPGVRAVEQPPAFDEVHLMPNATLGEDGFHVPGWFLLDSRDQQGPYC